MPTKVLKKSLCLLKNALFWEKVVCFFEILWIIKLTTTFRNCTKLAWNDQKKEAKLLFGILQFNSFFEKFKHFHEYRCYELDLLLSDSTLVETAWFFCILFEVATNVCWTFSSSLIKNKYSWEIFSRVSSRNSFGNHDKNCKPHKNYMQQV